MSNSESQETGNRSHALDGLRGFAAVAVVFYHAILHNDLLLIDRVLHQPLQSALSVRDALTKLALVLQNGEMAVFVFFVLSGAVLRLSLDRRTHQRPVITCVAFTVVRLLRLYPPLLACLLFFYVLSVAGIPGYPQFEFRQLLENATLLKISMHGPSTTIQAEVMAIPFILCAWLLRRSIGLPGLMMIFVYGILALEFSRLVFSLPNMHAYLFAFIADMVAAEPMLRPLIQQVPATSWWLVFCVLIFCRTFHPQSSLTALVAMVISAALLVSGLLYGQRGSLSRMLEGRYAQLIGRVSFSLYLFNVPVLYLLWAYTDTLIWPKTHALEAGFLIGLLSLALTLPLAWASQQWIERWSVSLGHRLNRATVAKFGCQQVVGI